MVKKAFFGGALILVDMEWHDFNMSTNSNIVIWYFAWRSLSVHLISIFLCQKKKKNWKKKCEKVDQKLERAVYVKGKPKEREHEKIHKVDWKPEMAAYIKGEQKNKSVREPARLKTRKGSIGKN